MKSPLILVKKQESDMQPAHKYVPLNDIKMSYYEWGHPTDPVILLVHATGMNARVWDEVVKHLPAGHRIIAIDSRGHGQTQFKGHVKSWSTLGDDLIKFIQALDLKDIIVTGHSLGAHMVTQAIIALPDRFKRAVLIDPVMFEPSRYDYISDFEKGHPKDNPMSKRRNHFSNWQDMYARYKDRTPYSLWQTKVMEDYCQYGLCKTADGDGYELCCFPETETSIYMSHHSVNLTDKLSAIDIPVKVLRASVPTAKTTGKVDFLSSPTWPDLAKQFANGTDVYLPELTHFIPMQDPQLVAKHILS